MEIKVTIKLDSGKELKLSSSEVEELRNALNNISGTWYGPALPWVTPIPPTITWDGTSPVGGT